MENKVLKQPGVCRIFFSSPFNGMEGEREEFTRRYWPQIDAFCKSKGVQFVPVDMRWGITTELSNNNQTINICLGEIDRSDLFVGFFGQRYGWHGETDETLQKNFDAATPSFPWIDNFRNKSITELEFFHGHLNDPGGLPAVICFRSKAFDDTHREVALAANDKRGVYKYSSESEVATELMDDLKARVKETEQLCLAINMSYSTPEEGAKFMFDVIWKHLTEVLLKTTDKLIEVEQEYVDHSAFYKTLTTSYVPCEQLLGKLDTHISQESESRALLVTGEGGSGKTSLLANWIPRLESSQTSTVLVYHFVGCTAESALVKKILLHIVSSLQFKVESSSKSDKSKFWHEIEQQLISLEEPTLAKLWVHFMEKCASSGKRVVIIVDGLDRINYGGFEKTVQPLFWVPTSLPSGCYLILSTGSDDARHLKVLKEKLSYEEMVMGALSVEQQQQMSAQALKLRGKTLSRPQMAAVAQASATCNPLFLNIVLEELCMFGKFRELDAKIESLVSCENSVALFDKYLERMETDYNSSDYEQGNLVQQVTCALAVSRLGLQETELMEMLHIPQNLWPPLYYGLSKYIVSHQGFLRLAHKELESAIYNRYITDKKTYLDAQRKYYMTVLNKHIGIPLPDHLLKELVWTAYACEHRSTMIQVLTTPAYFENFLVKGQAAYVFEYLQWLGYDQEGLVALYHRTFTRYMAMDYSEQMEEDLLLQPNVLPKLFKNLKNFDQFLRFAHYLKAQKTNLLRMQRIVENNKQVPADKLFDMRLEVYMRLAQTCLENHDTEEATLYNMKIIQLVDEKYSDGNGPVEAIDMKAVACHTEGMNLMQMNRLDEASIRNSKMAALIGAEEYFQKSIELQKKFPSDDGERSIKQSEQGLAEVLLKRGQFQESADVYEENIKWQEEKAGGTLSIELSFSLTFLALCYRRLEQYDKAERCLDRAMDIKKMVLGDNHRDVAIGYFNNANLADDRKDLEGMVTNLDKALDIHKYLGDTPVENYNMFLAYDNKIMALVFLQRWEQTHELYFSIFDVIKERFDLAMSFNHDNIMRYCLRSQKFEDAYKILKLLVKSKHAQPDHFLFLQMLRSEGHISDVEPLTPEMSLQTAMQKFPDKEDLLFGRIQFELAPAKDSGAIIATIEDFLKDPSRETARIVCISADRCGEWKMGRIAILEHWSQKMPECEDFVRNLAATYNELQDYAKATECLRKAVQLNPSMPVLQDKLAMALILQGRIEEARQEIQILSDRFGSLPQMAEIAQKYTEALDEMVASQKEQEKS